MIKKRILRELNKDSIMEKEGLFKIYETDEKVRWKYLPRIKKHPKWKKIRETYKYDSE